MKILHVTYEPPAFPGGTGGQTRQYGLLKHLSKDHEIHAVFPCKNQHEQAALREEVFASVSMPPPKTFFTKLLYLALKYRHPSYPQFVRSYEGMRYSMTPLMAKEIKSGNYELINVEHTNVAHWLFPFISSIPTIVPTVLVAHNVKTVMWQRFFDNEVGKDRKRLFGEYKKFQRYEEKYLRGYDCLIAMSDTDRQFLWDVCPKAKRIEIVPNGVDLEYFSSQPGIIEEPQSLLFTGTMGHPPNEEAMNFFCGHIFPAILKAFPNTTMTIVGRGPSTIFLKRWGTGNNIHITGFVPDSRPYFDKAQIFVVPLLSGSGTRLKILEAMSMGKSIVSTSIGAEGIDYTDGKDIIIADDVGQFTQSVLELLKNQERRKRLGEAARQLVFNKYSWNALAKQLETIYLDVTRCKKR